MSERQSGRRAPWPERDPRETTISDQLPEEAPAEVSGDEQRPPEDEEDPDAGDQPASARRSASARVAK